MRRSKAAEAARRERQRARRKALGLNTHCHPRCPCLCHEDGAGHLIEHPNQPCPGKQPKES